MVINAERTFDVAVPPENVWGFMADPEHRAQSISVVADFDRIDEDRMTWHLSIPISAIDKTVTVETKDTVRDSPSRLEFVGRSDVGRIEGEHEFTATETGTRVTNQLQVDGSVPGIETYFEENLGEELDNLETTIRTELESDSEA
jgi:carbon monoxide dehydrogenase subunit G